MFNFKDVYINNYFSIVGPVEAKSNLKGFNLSMDDYYYGEKTFEKAEIKMQNVVLNNLLKKSNPDLVMGTDLLNQMIITNMSLKERNLPYLGLYSACASSTGAIINLASLIDKKYIKEGLFITSAHNLNAEKQYRFPIEYGAPKPYRSTFTTTASIGFTLSKNPSKLKVLNGTIGCVKDSYVKDIFNMGAIMAISAADTLIRHLKLTKTTPEDYDLILTGDLGKVGAEIFKELLEKENITLNNHLDSGTLIYENEEYAGGSGPAVLPLVFFNNIIHSKKYKKILLLATGSLHSPALVNQKNSIPAICHAVTIEVLK